MTKPNSLPTRVKLYLKDHPGSSDAEICAALNVATDALTMKSFRCCTRRLEMGGFIKRDKQTGAWTLFAFSFPAKPPVNKHFAHSLDTPRREFVSNRGWTPHHVRDYLVSALFGEPQMGGQHVIPN